jgi:hypothetical protein
LRLPRSSSHNNKGSPSRSGDDRLSSRVNVFRVNSADRAAARRLKNLRCEHLFGGGTKTALSRGRASFFTRKQKPAFSMNPRILSRFLLSAGLLTPECDNIGQAYIETNVPCPPRRLLAFPFYSGLRWLNGLVVLGHSCGCSAVTTRVPFGGFPPPATALLNFLSALGDAGRPPTMMSDYSVSLCNKIAIVFL